MSSRFDSKDRVPCLENTRSDILDRVFCWINIQDMLRRGDLMLKGQSDNGNAAMEDTCIFWINGSAGTGKTTIAYTIAERCRADGVLGASFFCSRDDADCSNPGLIFTTIAYQLGQSNALFAAEVTRALKSNPDIGYSSVPYQLEQLIVKPLPALKDSFPPRVVVLNALDECKDGGTTSTILFSLTRYVTELSPLKFFVTIQ
jgi:hypothetical protein